MSIEESEVRMEPSSQDSSGLYLITQVDVDDEVSPNTKQCFWTRNERNIIPKGFHIIP